MSVWKAILNCWPLVCSKLSFEVGDGQRVKFWNLEEGYPSCLFWTVWETRNRIVLKDYFCPQRLKPLFIFLLWSETRNIIQKVSFRWQKKKKKEKEKDKIK